MPKTNKLYLTLAFVAALSFFGRTALAGDEMDRRPPTSGELRASIKTRYQWSVKPFKVVGNIYYVGLNENGSWLITTPQGHFLMDEYVSEEVVKSMDQLGFKAKDIKYLLVSHAHNDTVLGLADMKRLSGAKVVAMGPDAKILAGGGASDNFLFNMQGPAYPPVKADIVADDGIELTLGGVTVTGHLTPGHTPGCATWTTEAEEKGKKYKVVLFGNCGLMNQPLVGNKHYPNVAADFQRQYKTLRALHGDVLAGLRGMAQDMIPILEKNPAENPFIDPKGYDAWVDKNEKRFQEQLKTEQAGGKSFPLVVPASPSCPKDRACYNVYDLLMKCCAKLGAKPIK